MTLLSRVRMTLPKTRGFGEPLSFEETESRGTTAELGSSVEEKLHLRTMKRFW